MSLVLLLAALLAAPAAKPSPTPARTPTAEQAAKLKELRADFAHEVEAALLDRHISARVRSQEGLGPLDEYYNSRADKPIYSPHVQLVIAWPLMSRSDAWNLMKKKGRPKILRTDFLRSMGFEQVLLENGFSGAAASGYVYDLIHDGWWEGERTALPSPDSDRSKDSPKMGVRATAVSVGFSEPDYLEVVRALVNANWLGHETTSSPCVLSVTVQRSGAVTEIKAASGDCSSETRALRAAIPFPPLPDRHRGETLGVRFEFR